MSHGGMGGGGHGHHGGHHGGGLAGHHADQSASWNMAMQVEKDLGRRTGFLDPRIIVGLTLFGFVTLLSLPYTLDYFQNQHIAEKAGAVIETVPESSGPNAASLSMIGATLAGGGVHLPENLGGAGHSSGGGEARDNSAAGDKDSSFNGDREYSSNSDDDEQSASSRDDRDEHRETASGSIMNPADTPQIVNQSAQETVTKMLAASGMAQRGGNSAVSGLAQSAATPAAFGMAEAPQSAQQAMTMAPQAVAPPAAYGGVMAPAAGSQYAVYVPNAQFGQPSSVPAANLAAPTQFASAASMAAPAAVPAMAGNHAPILSAQAFDPRSPFNPQTSAISCPLGMRRHGGTAGGIPIESTPGADGSHRFRVFVSR